MINKIFISLFILVTGGEIIYGQQTRFEEANDLLSTNRVEEALELYQSLESEGFESGALWFNMGISYVHLDSAGKAKYYFLRSKTHPNTEEIAAEAIEFLNERFSRRSAVLPKLPWDVFFDWLSKNVGKNSLMIIGLLLFNGAVGAVIASWFLSRGTIWFRRTGYLFTILSFLFIAASLYINQLDNRYETGVMIGNQTSLYQSPNKESAVISSVFEGYEMTVDTKRSSEHEDWSYVRLQNGMYGWIDEQQLMSF